MRLFAEFLWQISERITLSVVATIVLASCASPAPPISSGHIKPAGKPAQPAAHERAPPVASLPNPAATAKDKTYTIVVSDVPIRDLLFALAREAGVNIDIHPDIKGNVTINAIEQTLPQIIDRLSAQIPVRYERNDSHYLISPDLPYFVNYSIDYTNMARNTSHKVSLSTQIASTGTSIEGSSTAGNNSTTETNSSSSHRFWRTLVINVMAILNEQEALTLANTNTSDLQTGVLPATTSVIANAESGLLTVHATQKQHVQIRNLIDRIQENAQRQVLIEATIVEVGLSQEYSAGVDWSRIANSDGGLSYNQSSIGNNFANLPFFTATYANADSILGNIAATVTLLEQFGDVKILSSPKIMVLNNQNAVLKVVDNIVYFTITVESGAVSNGIVTPATFESELNTVPVGLVMTVTPQISAAGKIIMNVRPTVSRIIEYVSDPAVSIASANAIASTPVGGVPPAPVESLIPVVQVREFESMLRIDSGQVAVLGGLMQDAQNKNTSGLPGSAKIPIIGDLFNFKQNEYTKTELVVFLRPTLINNPAVEKDLSTFKPFLQRSTSLSASSRGNLP